MSVLVSYHNNGIVNHCLHSQTRINPTDPAAFKQYSPCSEMKSHSDFALAETCDKAGQTCNAICLPF